MFVKDFPSQDSTTQNVFFFTNNNNLVAFSPSQTPIVTTFLPLELLNRGDLRSILTQNHPFELFFFLF